MFLLRHSSEGFFNEVRHCLSQFNENISILDLCCGIGVIGISLYLNHYPTINKFYGFDNDVESIELCKKNILHHKINGEAYIWEAGEKLPEIKIGVAVCNPPFLPENSFHSVAISKSSLVYSSKEGLEVLLNCFRSLIGTKHILVLKSLENQVLTIQDRVKKNYKLLRKVDREIETNYKISFTTWGQK